MKLTKKQQQNAVNAYKAHKKVSQIAQKYGVSRQAVYKLIKNTNTPLNPPKIITKPCCECGAPVTRHASRMQAKNTYCSKKCQIPPNPLWEKYKKQVETGYEYQKESF